MNNFCENKEEYRPKQMEAVICKATEEQKLFTDITERDGNKSFPGLQKGNDSLYRSNSQIKE